MIMRTFTALMVSTVLTAPVIAQESPANLNESPDAVRDTDGTIDRSMDRSVHSDSQAAMSAAHSTAGAHGLKKEQIKDVQEALREKDALEGSADGVWGPQTEAALKQFQRDHNIAATGQLDERTIAALGLDESDFPAPQSASSPANQREFN